MIRICFLLVLFLSSMHAHKINLFASDENGTLFIQAYFTQSSPCQACEIVLLQNDEKLILSAQTNALGTLSLPLPAQSSFLIVVKATMGHQNQISYTPTSLAHESASTTLTQQPWFKMLFALVCIVVLFGVLGWLKRKH